MNPHKERLEAQAEAVRGKLQDLTADLRTVDDEVEGLARQRTEHDLLARACDSLEELGKLGAASLFWGDGTDATDVRAHRQTADCDGCGPLEEPRQLE